jgi:hypothetical protein
MFAYVTERARGEAEEDAMTASIDPPGPFDADVVQGRLVYLANISQMYLMVGKALRESGAEPSHLLFFREIPRFEEEARGYIWPKPEWVY